jgi:hypothetical protein
VSSQLISRNDLKIPIESNLTKVIEIYLSSGEIPLDESMDMASFESTSTCLVAPLGK